MSAASIPRPGPPAAPDPGGSPAADPSADPAAPTRGPVLSVTLGPAGLVVHAAPVLLEAGGGLLAADLPGRSGAAPALLRRLLRHDDPGDDDPGTPWSAVVRRPDGTCLAVVGAAPGPGLAAAATAGGWTLATHVAPVLARLPRLDLDPAALGRMMVGVPGTDTTVWVGVGYLGSGTTSRLHPDRPPATRRWFALDPARRASRVDVAAAVGRVRAALDRSVADCLPPGGDVACELSGGLDSTSVVTSAAALLRHGPRRVRAYVSTPLPEFDGEDGGGWLNDDLPYAEATAAACGGVDVEPVRNTDLVTVVGDPDRFFAPTGLPAPNTSNLTWVYGVRGRVAAAGGDRVLVGSAGNWLYSADMPLAHARLLAAGHVGLVRRSLAARARRADLSRVRMWRMLVAGPLAAASGAYRAPLPGSLRMCASLLRPGPRAELGLDEAQREWVTAARTRPWQLAMAVRPDPTMLVLGTAAWGVATMDPLGHPRLLRAFAELPDQVWAATGRSRPVAREVLDGRAPDAVRLRRERGLQSPDSWLWSRGRRDAYADLLDAAEADPLAGALVDVPRLRRALSWFGPGTPGPDNLTLVTFERVTGVLAFVRWARGYRPVAPAGPGAAGRPGDGAPA